MAKFVLTGEHLSIDSTDISALGVLKSAELTVEAEVKDVTNHASGGWKEVLAGIKSASLKIIFFQDFAAANIDAKMWPLIGTVVTFAMRATSAAASATNPSYSGSILINGWNPVEGSVGDEATVSVTYQTSGAVSRATS